MLLLHTKGDASISNDVTVTAHIPPCVLYVGTVVKPIHPLEGSAESNVSDDNKHGDRGRSSDNVGILRKRQKPRCHVVNGRCGH